MIYDAHNFSIIMDQQLVLVGKKRQRRRKYSLLNRYLGMRPNDLHREQKLIKYFRDFIQLEAIVDQDEEADIAEILEMI